MKIFNTLDKAKRGFVPLEPGKGQYVCLRANGIQLHSYLGNARPMIVFDTVRQLF